MDYYQDKHKEIHVHIIAQMIKMKNKENIQKTSSENKSLHKRAPQLDGLLIFQQKYWRPKGSGITYSKPSKKKMPIKNTMSSKATSKNKSKIDFNRLHRLKRESEREILFIADPSCEKY